MGSTAPQTVTIPKSEVSVAKNKAVTIDFTPAIQPAGAVLPEGMESLGYVGIGKFYDALDYNVYEESGNQVRVAFTEEGEYLLTRCYVLRNLKYVTSCTIKVGTATSGLRLLQATETWNGGWSVYPATVLPWP